MGGKVLEMESDRILNEGRMDEKQTIAIRLYQKGTKAEDIADIVDAKVNIVRKWIETLR